MLPRLLTTPFFTVHTFGLLLASAYMAAFWWLTREGRREGLDADELASLGFWAIAGAIIGALYKSESRMTIAVSGENSLFVCQSVDRILAGSHSCRIKRTT